LGLSNVVVRNIPAGGGILGANQIATAPPDGLLIGTFNTGTIYAQLLRRGGMEFDLRRLSWIGKAGDEPRVFTVSSRSGFRSFNDVRNARRPVLLAAASVSNAGYYDAVLLAHALNLSIKPVFGMFTRDSLLSMMRGEVDGEIASASTHRAFVENGYGHTLLRVGKGEGVDEKVPDAMDLVTSEKDRALVNIVRLQATLLRWTAGPPEIPEDRLAALRDAYMAVVRDAEFINEARKFRIPVVPMDGATLASEINKVLDQPTGTVEFIGSLVDANANTVSTKID
jgi:tripartite-type tricarboxylate transporter receptor subunit TctC